MSLLEFVDDPALLVERETWYADAGIPELPPPTFPEPPRRWESGKGDSWRWLVLVDGERVEQALTADVDTGCVTEAVLDDRGGLNVKDGYPERTRCGAVEIVSWRDWHAASAAWFALGLRLAGALGGNRNRQHSSGTGDAHR